MQELNPLDWLILVVILGSMLVSLWRGFVREALSLVSWVLALVLALMFSERLAAQLALQIGDPTGRYLLAFAILFIGVLVVGALAGRLLRSLVELAGLGLLDRMLGMVFGGARGVLLLLALAVFLRPSLQLDTTPLWRESLLLPHLLLLEGWFSDAAASLRDLALGLWH